MRIFRKTLRICIPSVLLLLGCRLEGNAAGGLPATQTALAFSVRQYSTSAGGRFAASRNPFPAATAGAPSPTGTSTPTETPAETVTATPTSTSTIAHRVMPSGAGGTASYITDISSRDDAPRKKAPAGYDVYQNNSYERPFTAEEMAYLPDVDLTRVEMCIDPPWVYITFQFVEPRAAGIGQTMYGAEFDINKDGRGDYLIWGASPPGDAWTTDGVEVWKDTNYDVGGPTPQATDAPWTSGNGYDQNLFRSGVGSDPDLAWIRQIEGGAKVQLAFKYSAIGGAPRFLWNGLADAGVRNPAWFDYNDYFTQGQAGSPLPVQSDFYPLQALYGLDNTCRNAFGFSPTGSEARLCV
jgi:hypothetical protein